MKRPFILFIITFCIISQYSYSQNKLSRKEYIETFKWIAVREMHRSGIPASITMAQACLESENGNSELSKKSNNHFGIKCKSDWKGERSYHDDDHSNECFRKYNTVEESFVDHTDFLFNNPRYQYLFKLSNKDYDAWAKGLKAAGYATDPQYPQRLIKIINEENLHLLDEIKPEDMPATDILAVKGKNYDPYEVKNKEVRSFSNISINPFSRRDIKQINDLDAIYVREGDTYESIAAEFEMKTWEILVYNDLKKNALQPIPGTFLYLERKRCLAQKGNEKHILAPNETLWGVAQKYGITLCSLKCKNRIKKGIDPIAGDPLYLRKMKPRQTKKKA